MSTIRTRGGYRLADTKALEPIVRDALYKISAICSHGNDAGSEARMLRLARIFGHWVTSTAEAAFESDAETEAVEAIDADLSRILAERKAGERGDSDV